jgi:uncharacterized sodium:solute symporter family permease YidK
MVGTYIFFSPLGVAKSDSGKTIEYGIILTGLIFAFLFFMGPLLWRKYRVRESV